MFFEKPPLEAVEYVIAKMPYGEVKIDVSSPTACKKFIVNACSECSHANLMNTCSGSMAQRCNEEKQKVKNAYIDNLKGWIYEVGREEPEILGSGSNYYDVKKTKDKEEAFALAGEKGRNYIQREINIVGNRHIVQQWDFYEKCWI